MLEKVPLMLALGTRREVLAYRKRNRGRNIIGTQGGESLQAFTTGHTAFPPSLVNDLQLRLVIASRCIDINFAGIIAASTLTR